jgi:hypothetical protein
MAFPFWNPPDLNPFSSRSAAFRQQKSASDLMQGSHLPQIIRRTPESNLKEIWFWLGIRRGRLLQLQNVKANKRTISLERPKTERVRMMRWWADEFDRLRGLGRVIKMNA